jgi:hypothetical protein
MTIRNPEAYASNETKVHHHRSGENVRLLSDINTRRRNGIIINNSTHTLLIYLGKKTPTTKADWLAIPHLGNADIPFMYIGKIWGCWLGTDTNGATIHEFYGDFST